MLLFYSTYQTPRLDYILDHVLTIIFGLEWKLSTDEDEFNAYSGPKINYSEKKIGKTFWIEPSGLLNETGIRKMQSECFMWKNLPVFFKVSDEADLPFDIFSMAFYLISRYEEYLPGIKFDMHGRYIATQSIAFRNKFLEIPLIDVLLVHLRKLLQDKYAKLKFKDHQYYYQPTYDVDMLFSYKTKQWWRLAGGFVRSVLTLQWHRSVKRLQVALGGLKDPFDNFEELYQGVSGNSNSHPPLAFINVGRYGAFDKNNPVSHPFFVQALNKLKGQFQLALHPSYRSNDHIQDLKNEVFVFEELTGIKPLQSRQHFLRLTFPYTYRDLLAVGIKEDYSMGYPSHIGFRAATSFSFYFYDLLKEEKTVLKVHPFAFMDGTLFDYMKLSYEQALLRLEKMYALLNKMGGVMCGIWHNSYIADIPSRLEFYKEVSGKIKSGK